MKQLSYPSAVQASCEDELFTRLELIYKKTRSTTELSELETWCLATLAARGPEDDLVRQTSLDARIDVLEISILRALLDDDAFLNFSPRAASAISLARTALSQEELTRLDDDVRLIYETVCLQGKRRPLLFDPPEAGEGRLTAISRRARTSAFWTRTVAVCTLLAAAACLFPLGRLIVFALIAGLAGASINEYLVHLGIGHASILLATAFRRFGWAGRFAEEINLAHRVHHSKMFTDFRAEFTDEKTLRRVDTYLAVEAEKMVESRVRAGITQAQDAASERARIERVIKAGGYGVNGTIKGTLAMHVLALPYFAANALLAVALGSLTFFVLASIVLSAFIIQSMYSHRYLHFTANDMERATEIGTTTAVMRWFMRSALGQLQLRRHYRHHQERFEYAKTANGVIMSFNFADFIFRRGVREAEIPHLVKMRKEGFLPWRVQRARR